MFLLVGHPLLRTLEFKVWKTYIYRFYPKDESMWISYLFVQGAAAQIFPTLLTFQNSFLFHFVVVYFYCFFTSVFKRDIVSAWRHVQLCSGAADRISEFAPHYTMSCSYTPLQNTEGKYKIQNYLTNPQLCKIHMMRICWPIKSVSSFAIK